MFIIWKGYGIFVLFIGSICFGIIGITVDKLLGNDYFSKHTWPAAAGFFLAGILTWFLGRYLNNLPSKKEPGTKQVHSIFFLKMEYWGIVFAIIGVIAALV